MIAIIGILSALLLAAVSKAKARAQRVYCANNVRQLGLGVQLFVTDNHHYPLLVNGNYSKGAYPEDGSSWDDAVVIRELGAKDLVDKNNHAVGVWRCPALVYRVVETPVGEINNSATYGYNGLGLSRIGENTRDVDSLGLSGDFSPPIHPSDVVKPSDMIEIGDGFSGKGEVILDLNLNISRNNNWDGSKFQPYLNYKEITKAVYARHQDKANVVFCDGHVESPTLQFLFEETNDGALAIWNRDHLPHREELSR